MVRVYYRVRSEGEEKTCQIQAMDITSSVKMKQVQLVIDPFSFKFLLLEPTEMPVWPVAICQL